MRLRKAAKGLLRHKQANISTIFAILALPMTLAAGGAIDVAMQEHDRLRLQSALDASLIAAASISQTMEAEETIRSYLDAAGLEGYALTVSETKSVSARTVTASATMSTHTNFLHLIDIPTLDVVASGTAEEAYQNIELSLVLDLSGSMRENNRIKMMRPAAKNFVSQLLTEKTKAFTSISIVPFAGQVNVGAAFFDAVGGKRLHDKSSCFSNLKYTSWAYGIPDFTKTDQVPHFSTWELGKNDGFDPWNCPTQETSISYFSNDEAKLHTAIDGYHMFDGTATHIAVEWGTYLLDPAFKSVITKAASAGVNLVPPQFADRPAAFNDRKTMKIMVVMTDGEVVGQFRPKSGAPVNEQKKKGDPDPNEEKLSRAKTLEVLIKACANVKSKGVTVYTIGYDVETYGAALTDALKGCASGEGRYYKATASNINKIFQDVALSIYPLRLTN